MKLLFVVLICAFVFLVCFLIDTLFKLIFPKSKLEKSTQVVRPPRRRAVIGVILTFAGVAMLVKNLAGTPDTLFLIGSAVAVIFGVLLLCGTFVRGALPVFRPSGVPERSVIVIDAGHGGEDGGAVAADGTVESGINLAIAQDLDALLRFLGCETRMTRTEDAAIYSDGARTLREKKASDLKNRVALVNETPNAVLLSIHQNSLPASRRVHGAQAFHARTEGSEALAESVQVALNAAVNPGNEKSRKVIDKSVYLMKNISCPAVLVECGFLSNAEEAARLCETDYQRKLAVTVAAGFLAGLAGGQAAA